MEILNDENRLNSLMNEKIREKFYSMDKKHWFRKSQYVTFKYDSNGSKMPRKALFLYGDRTEIVSIL